MNMKYLMVKGFSALLLLLLLLQCYPGMGGYSSSLSSIQRVSSHDDLVCHPIHSGVYSPDSNFLAIKNLLEADPSNNDFQPTLEATYFALRSIALLNRTKELNSVYPNYPTNFIMSRYNESLGLFQEPINEYNNSDTHFKLLGCGQALTNAYAVLALFELNQSFILSAGQRQVILNFLLNSQNPDGSFGGVSGVSRAADTYFILNAILRLDRTALSEVNANLTKTWVKERQVVSTLFGTQGGFPHPFQSASEFAYMYETAFTLRVASMLNFSDYNLPYLFQYFNYLYEPSTGFVYNTRPLPPPNEIENPLNLIHTTSALFYLSIAEQNISGGYDFEAFLSYLLNQLTVTGRWLTGIEGGKYEPMHSLETYWIALEMISKYNRISMLPNATVQNLYWTIMNFSKLEASKLFFTMVDHKESSFSYYLIRQIYRTSFEIINSSEKEQIYQRIKAHYNPLVNSFLEMRSAGHFFQMKFNSYFLPFEVRGFKLDSISGYIFHPRNTFLAITLLDTLDLLPRFLEESNLAKFVDSAYASTLVNTNATSNVSGGFFIFSWNGYRLPIEQYREWISPDITYYHLKTIALLASHLNKSITEVFSSDLIALMSGYIRAHFPVLQQHELIRSAKLWESLTILNSTTLVEQQIIKNTIQVGLFVPEDKDLYMLAMVNDLLPYYRTQITLPTQLQPFQNRVQQLLQSLGSGPITIQDIYLLNRILEITLFNTVSEIPDTLVLGRYFDASLRIETLSLKNAIIRSASMNLKIENISYSMRFSTQGGYRVSTAIYQNFSSKWTTVHMIGSINPQLPINVSKLVQVSANFIISLLAPSDAQNCSKWMWEEGTLKGTFLINSSYKNYAEQALAFDGFMMSLEAFDLQGNPIEGIKIHQSKEEMMYSMSTTIKAEIPATNESNIKIKFKLTSPLLKNSSFQKPDYLTLADNGEALVYESIVNISQVKRNSDTPSIPSLPELPLNVYIGTGFSTGMVFIILKISSKRSKKRLIDPEPCLY